MKNYLYPSKGISQYKSEELLNIVEGARLMFRIQPAVLT